MKVEGKCVNRDRSFQSSLKVGKSVDALVFTSETGSQRQIFEDISPCKKGFMVDHLCNVVNIFHLVNFTPTNETP